MTAIVTNSAGFTKIRSRAYPPNFDHCRGFWRFGVDAATSLKNLVPDAAQTGAFEGTNFSFGDNYVEFTGTDSGFNSGLDGADAAYTMLLLCTRPTGVSSQSGLYAGFHDAESGVRGSIGYQGGSNTNFYGAGGALVGSQSYSQGTSYAMLYETNDGTGGLYGHASGAALTGGSYTRAPNTGTFPFRVGRGRTTSGSGSNAHTMRVHSAALFDTALDATALLAQWVCFSTWATDVGLLVA